MFDLWKASRPYPGPMAASESVVALVLSITIAISGSSLHTQYPRANDAEYDHDLWVRSLRDRTRTIVFFLS